MRPLLLGTGTLVATGMAVSTGQSAMAAERLKLGVAGYHQHYIVYAAQSGVSQSAQAPLDVKNNGEIWFKGETRLDSGLRFGVDVQFESTQNADQVDEAYAWFEFGRLGRLIVGDENGVAYLFHVWAPNAGIGLETGTIGSVGGAYANSPGASLFSSPYGNTTGRGLDNDSAKVSYVMPRLAGLQAGVSYTPRFRQDSNNAEDDTVSHNGWDVAVNYKADLGPVGIAAMAGIKWADAAGTVLATDDAGVRLWKAGASVTAYGVAIGGGWLRQASGLIDTSTSVRGQSWIVGARYKIGAWSLGAGYFYGDSEDLTTVDGADSHEKWIIDGSVELAPGILATAGAFAFDLDSEGTIVENAAGLGGVDNHGWGAIAGVKLSF